MKINSIFKIIFIISVIVSVCSSVYFFNSQENLLYRDAKSHLNIANRVFNSQTPGIAQLGGTWLPMPHVLMFPLIWNDFSYYSGLAGAIPSMVSFVALSVTIAASVHLYTKDKMATFLASALLVSNPSLLYLQSTSMSELPLLAFTSLSIVFFLRWAYERKHTDMVLSAFFICLATLTRYDAWFMFVFQIGLIILLALISRNSYKKLEGHLFLFVFMGGFGIILWLIYNNLIFGDFLNFALGQGSGSWDANRVSTASNLSTKHNLTLSFMTYLWMVIDNVGLLTFIAGVIGFILIMLSRVNKFLKLGALVFLSPFIFNVVSLYLGQSVAFSKHIAPFETYNLRYGIAFLPATAFFLGILASKNIYVKACVLLLIAVQGYIFYTKPLDILLDANVGNIDAEIKVARWIKDNPTDGNVLLSTLAHDPLLFEARIPMQKLIYEGNQHLWKVSLLTPEKYASRVVFKESDTVNDAVRKALYNKPVLKVKYSLSYDDGDYKVYDKKNNN